MCNKKVFIDTLGCPKNFNDSEFAAGILEENGYEIIDSPEDADIIMVNTCGFINDAKKESIEHIFEMNERRKDGGKLVVSGCLSQRYSEELSKEIPEADCIIGVNQYNKLPEILSDIDNNHVAANSCDLDYLEKTVRKLSDNPYTATLKIAEGCNNTCTYCIIPMIRGKFRSKKMEDIITEAKELANAGCKELILIAQDVTYYGKDLYGKFVLPELLRKLCKIDGIEWIRLMYCYDERITDELIQVMAEEDKICKYIDIPLQHASDNILRSMRRQTTRKSIKDTLAKLKAAMPDIHVRTTLIVGFPGETEDDYDQLLELVESERFSRLGVFTYSQEENTVAAEMDNQIDEDIKQTRFDGVMRRQMLISSELNQEKIGKVFDVIVDRMDEDGSFIGRTRFDAPEIDNSVIFTSKNELQPGDIVKVKINDAFDYDIIGEEL
ncbi:MAG: 30S ribosomal protein S12 methylthiotransferase RimO [[Eubacterium] sulci]|nr:30S ribosomal protein S12 methylthiotransferase RimO [[Eubacterium] sulci]